MPTDSRRNYVVRIDKHMQAADLQLAREFEIYERTMSEIMTQCAERMKAAGMRMREAVNAMYLGDLWKSADPAQFQEARERARSKDFTILDVVPPPVFDQKRFDMVVAEIEKRLEEEDARELAPGELPPFDPEDKRSETDD